MVDIDRQRFFIALLPPQAVQDYVNGVKQVFGDRYYSRAAFKSPPHITLQPPFEWSMQHLSSLSQLLADFALQTQPVPIHLSGFGAFVPRVIFVNVVKTPALLTLQKQLLNYTETHLDLVDPVSKTRPFAPHMTVGFRDLTKPNFHAAWAEFQHQTVEFEFITTHLTLLIHDGKQWNICQEFPFSSVSSVPSENFDGSNTLKI